MSFPSRMKKAWSKHELARRGVLQTLGRHSPHRVTDDRFQFRTRVVMSDWLVFCERTVLLDLEAENEEEVP
jgi:hypothetical protein